MAMAPTARLDPDTLTFAPLALDALTARIAAAAGFRSVYVSGGALGYAHAVSEALLTLSELVDVTAHITARSGQAVIVDGGVGFGDAVHVDRTIRAVEATGAAAIEIEDQVAPKRVSHHRGIEHLVSTNEMVAKIEVAVAARRDPDFAIIARTGATKNESLEQAIARGNAYREAGADYVMLMANTTADWQTAVERIAAPIATITSLDARPPDEWQRLGVKLVIDPFTAQVLAVEAAQAAYHRFIRDGHTGVQREALFATYKSLPHLAGLDPYYAIEDATTERDQ